MSYRAGFVGLIGQPNAGKSTLLNALVREKISIVTPKPQTTRRRILGVTSRPAGQIVFVDAPGIVRASKGLNAFLQKEAEDVIKSSDVLMAVVSVDEKQQDDVGAILDMCAKSKKPMFVVITKVDVTEKFHRVLKIKEMVEAIKPGTTVIEFSNKWGTDLDLPIKAIEDKALELLPVSPAPLYDSEIFTPHTVRDLVGEIIREKCFETLDKEIPYGIAVRVVKYEEPTSKKSMPQIYADLVLPKEGHKAIVIGKSAVNLKEIGMRSRKEIEKLVGGQVFLKLEVVVRENWFENQKIMKDLGYVVDKN